MEKVARPTRPEPVIRFYVEGQEVDPEGFWQAVRELGGQAVVTAHDPKPLEPGYRLTDEGRAALGRAQEAGR